MNSSVHKQAKDHYENAGGTPWSYDNTAVMQWSYPLSLAHEQKPQLRPKGVGGLWWPF